MSLEEKGSSDVIHVENLEDTKSLEYDQEFERKTIRRVDIRMLPLLGLLYSVSLIDRANLAIARTAGMEEDLVH
ncbi:hypothetical protein VKT23_004703 [Stygiomarasmius scandens]|uniref:MFS transporter n=1 Tax=Marasmiellus scandens TaxID=2682957 RepID=A0ABR1JVF3_9AGAR